jgi:hypothetical protein
MPHGVRVHLDAGVVDLNRTAMAVVKGFNAPTKETGPGFVVREYQTQTDNFSNQFSIAVNRLIKRGLLIPLKELPITGIESKSDREKTEALIMNHIWYETVPVFTQKLRYVMQPEWVEHYTMENGRCPLVKD